MTDWPEYVSHKKVRAALIVGFDTRDTGGIVTVWVQPEGQPVERFEPTRADMKEVAEVGGYAVIYTPDEKYPEGYRSISPAKAFEEGYTRVGDPT